MAARTGNIAFDCDHVLKLAAFWSAVLGRIQGKFQRRQGTGGFDEVVGVTGKAGQYVVSHRLTRNQRQKRRVRIRRGQSRNGSPR